NDARKKVYSAMMISRVFAFQRRLTMTASDQGMNVMNTRGTKISPTAGGKPYSSSSGLMPCAPSPAGRNSSSKTRPITQTAVYTAENLVMGRPFGVLNQMPVPTRERSMYG